jgi:hypothetical protein
MNVETHTAKGPGSRAQTSHLTRLVRGALGIFVIAAGPLVGCGSKQAIPATVQEELSSTNPVARLRAILELPSTGGAEETQILLRALSDTNLDVQRAAVASLGVRRCKEAVQPLIPLLRSDDLYVRRSVAHSLGNIGDRAAIVPLIEMIDESEKRPKDLRSREAWLKDIDAAEFSLSRLTGQNFGTNLAKWRAWLGETSAVKK